MQPPTGPPLGPRDPEIMSQPLSFEGAATHRPAERKDQDRFILDLEIEVGSTFVAVCDGTSDGEGAEAAEVATETTHDYVSDGMTATMGDGVGEKLLTEAIYVAHSEVERRTGTINTDTAYEEGGATTVALALIHPVESGGYELDWAAAGDSLLRVYDREKDSLIMLNAAENEGVIHNIVGNWSFGGLAGMTEGQGVNETGNMPWKSSYELIASSDGLDLPDERITEIMSENPDPEAATKALIDAAAAAVERPDDITCVIVRSSQTT